MTLLVFGSSGQLARAITARREAVHLGRDRAVLSHPEACAEAILSLKSPAVINAAVNTAIARARLGVPLVHLSTDYVFDGSGTAPFAPTAAPAPLNVYGRSEPAGEEAVRAAGRSHGILRTSWVFSAHGANFLRTMLDIVAERDTLRIVADQVGGPTPAGALAAARLAIAEQLCDAPQTSWAAFARAIFAAADMAVEVTGIVSADYPTAARRPLNSRLDCTATEAVFGIARPKWRRSLDQIIREISR